MAKHLKVTALVGMALLMTACASKVPEPENELAKRLVELQEAQRELELRHQALEQEKRTEELKTVPSWAINPPNPDGSGMYGVGIAQSKDLQHGMRASRLQAEFAVAAQYRQELSGSERAMSRGNSSGDVVNQTTFIIDKLVDAVPVVGYQIVETEVIPIRGVYHIYTLLRLPYDEFNQVLISQRAQEADAIMRAEFDDLERRLTARRAQREEERQREHQRELERMEARSRMLNQSTAEPQTPEEPEL